MHHPPRATKLKFSANLREKTFFLSEEFGSVDAVFLTMLTNNIMYKNNK